MNPFDLFWGERSASSSKNTEMTMSDIWTASDLDGWELVPPSCWTMKGMVLLTSLLTSLSNASDDNENDVDVDVLMEDLDFVADGGENRAKAVATVTVDGPRPC